MHDPDILVVGAGIAGLAAARSLAVAGLRVIVLEAGECVGGRICTERTQGEIVELGAEFVHGRPPELLALISEADLEMVERTGREVRQSGSNLIADDAEPETDVFSLLDALESFTGPDITFAQYLDDEGVPDDQRSSLIGFVEGFNAADQRIASAAALGVQQKAEDAIGGDAGFHITGGYDQLPSFLARRFEEHGGTIRLGTRVERIHWSSGQVTAYTSQGCFTARHAVVTVPLGVLQHGDLHFEPSLPSDFGRILSLDGPIRMGHVVRFTLIFRERFWQSLPPQPELSELSFLFTEHSVPPVWWTPYPEPSNTLTGWVGGPRSAELAGLNADALALRSCETLARIFHLDPGYISGLLVSCVTHDWSSDPNFLGAYSYIAKDGLSAPERLAVPIEDTLFLAGEHTDTTGHWGTVHAALGSGLRAARQIIEHLSLHLQDA